MEEEQHDEGTGVTCGKCNEHEIVEKIGRFGPFYVCSGSCNYILSTRPTGKLCPMCNFMMVEGTKTIPDRCGDKTCPNRNPHKLEQLKDQSLKPKLLKTTNHGEEHYFKIGIKHKESPVYDGVIIKFLEELGFSNPLPGDKTYKERAGTHKFFENEDYKLHVICSSDFLNLVLKCSDENLERFKLTLAENFD